MTEPDTTTMSGAEFQRHVGTDAQKWAEAFVCAGDRDGWLDAVRDERIAYAVRWFRDYAEVCVNAAVRDETEQAMRAPRGE